MDTKVLVVEDDQEINELLGEYLALEHFQYTQALSGRAALDAVQQSKPDAVVLDLMLPDIDGFQVANSLSLHRETYDVPIIILTCMNQQCDRERGIASGAYRFMNKPFLPDDLIGAVKGGLQWRQSLKMRPTRGLFAISASAPGAHLPGINEMIADLFCRTTISDAVATNIREAFQRFSNWVLDWGKANRRDPRVLIEYELLNADGAPAGNSPAFEIEWKLGEAAPGMLMELLFKPHSAGMDPFSGAWLNPGGPPAGSSPALIPWYQFLTLVGISTLERTGSSVRLHRTFSGPIGLPTVILDTTRLDQPAAVGAGESS
jgi:DNA-binding response OmpR family regulator